MGDSDTSCCEILMVPVVPSKKKGEPIGQKIEEFINNFFSL